MRGCQPLPRAASARAAERRDATRSTASARLVEKRGARRRTARPAPSSLRGDSTFDSLLKPGIFFLYNVEGGLGRFMSQDRSRSTSSSHSDYRQARQEGNLAFGENADTVREQLRLYVLRVAAQMTARRYVRSLTSRISEDLMYAALLLGPLQHIRDTDPALYRSIQRLVDAETSSAVDRDSAGSSTDPPNRRRRK